MGGGEGVKNVCFCPCSGYKNCPQEGGGQKIARFCPRSCWMTPLGVGKESEKWRPSSLFTICKLARHTILIYLYKMKKIIQFVNAFCVSLENLLNKKEKVQAVAIAIAVAVGFEWKSPTWCNFWFIHLKLGAFMYEMHVLKKFGLHL